MNRKTLSIAGMACDGCERNVESSVKALEGVTRVEADHESDSAEIVVDAELDDAALRAAVEEAGYDAPA